MKFVKHSELEGKHSRLFTASSPSWLNYKKEEAHDIIAERHKSSYSKDIGTLVHEYAAGHIRHSVKLNKNGKNELLFWLLQNGIPMDVIDISFIYPNLMNYVNDSIGFRMSPEVVLVYSKDFFGTADAISCRNGLLRISDLKTGKTPAHMEQLKVYAAYCILEYEDEIGDEIDIRDLNIELRLYQFNEVTFETLTYNDILPIIKTIEYYDQILNNLFLEV